MQQLQLFSQETTLSPSQAWQQLLSSINKDWQWQKNLRLVDAIEKDIDNLPTIKELGYSSYNEFWEQIENKRTEYSLSVRVLWTFRLIWQDRELSWFNKDYAKESTFLKEFNILTFNRQLGSHRINQRALVEGRLHWDLAKQKYGPRCTTAQLEEYAKSIGVRKENEQIDFLRAQLLNLHKQLEAANKGNLIYYGHSFTNKEIPHQYAEAMAMAIESKMNLIQLKTFSQILIFRGLYPACDYMRQFESGDVVKLIESLQ